MHQHQHATIASQKITKSRFQIEGSTQSISLLNELMDNFGDNKEEMLNAFSDDNMFEEYLSKLGKFIRCIGKGESFGELALKDSSPRSASVLCRTDCEFLILTKQHFDKMLLIKEREKEEFFRGIFPHLGSGYVSEVNFNHFLYSFKVLRLYYSHKI